MAPVSLFLRSVSRLKSRMETLTLTSRRLFSPTSMVQSSPCFSVRPPPPPYPAHLIPFIRPHLRRGNQEEDACAGSEDETKVEVEEKFDCLPKAKDVESEDSLRQLYERWLAYHKLSRPDPSEKEARFQIFQERAKRIYEFNKRGTETWTRGLTPFVDSDVKKGYPSSKDFIPSAAAAAAAAAAKESYCCYTEKDLESEDTIWSLYERWLSHYNLSRSPAEKRERFKTFKKNAEKFIIVVPYPPGIPHRILLREFADSCSSDGPTHEGIKV